MNKTSIEWVKNPDGTQGYTWNPITGCLNGCPYCYAKRLANGRLKPLYLANSCLPTHDESNHEAHHRDPFYPRFWEERLDSPNPAPHNRLSWAFLAKGIFVCDMGELFGGWIPKEWQDKVFYVIRKNPWHRFYLLTKQPQNLIKFSPFPENCWVGVTATDADMAAEGIGCLRQIGAKIKFMSFEPLLNRIPIHRFYFGVGALDWLIIGAMTGNLEDIKKMLMEYPQLTLMPYGKKWTLQPKLEWVEEIVKATDKAGIPVFLKNNLWPLFDGSKYAVPLWAFGKDSKLRQEMPK